MVFCMLWVESASVARYTRLRCKSCWYLRNNNKPQRMVRLVIIQLHSAECKWCEKQVQIFHWYLYSSYSPQRTWPKVHTCKFEKETSWIINHLFHTVKCVVPWDGRAYFKLGGREGEGVDRESGKSLLSTETSWTSHKWPSPNEGQ